MPKHSGQLTHAERQRERAENFDTAPRYFDHDEVQLAITVGKLRVHLMQRNRERVTEIVEEYFRSDPKVKISPRELPDDAPLSDVIDVRLYNALYAVGIATVGDARQNVTKDFRLPNFSAKSVETVMRAVGTWEAAG